MDTISQLYFEETMEQLENAEGCLNEMQQFFQPAHVDRLFRYIHSVKGSSDMMGFSEVKDLSHVLEDLLSQAREGKKTLTGELMDVCYQSVDTLIHMVENRKQDVHGSASVRLISESRNLIQQLQQISEESSFEMSVLREPVTFPEEPHASAAPVSISLPDPAAIKPPAPPAEVLLPDISSETSSPASNPLPIPVPVPVHRYYVRMLLSPDNPMTAVTRFLILKRLDENGVVIYTHPSRELIEAMTELPVSQNLQDANGALTFLNPHEMVFLYRSNLSRDHLSRELDVGYVEDHFVIDLGKTYQEYRMTKDDRAFFKYYFNEYARILSSLEQLTRQSRHGQQATPGPHWQKIHYSLIKISSRIIQLPSNERYHQWINAHQLAKDFFELETTANQPKTPALITYLKTLLMHAATDAWRLVKNEVVIKHLHLEEKQHVLLSLQNLSLELNPDLHQVLLVDVSAKNRLLESEVKSILSIFQTLKEKQIRPLLIHDGKNRLRIDQGTEPLPLKSLFVQYQYEHQLLEKALLQLCHHPFFPETEGGVS
ncbi:Hpt domain-containing protein [Anoxynatronum buryatiense]|uniref:P2 response regulator binding domain-containing protein n=1 Tax=Anoxynatronum buryatiense TaxID=489973 RepID=A0AA46AJ30_9CLOT|nr:Hpt domain-containing protein [Anoxynatronum buryatiense]SMP57875.1 P2 response regulator binding domain-containing protein [Anoxynatronum buryatiense]